MLVENIEIGKLIDIFANKSARNDFFSLIGLEMPGSKIKIKAGNKKKLKQKKLINRMSSSNQSLLQALCH